MKKEKPLIEKTVETTVKAIVDYFNSYGYKLSKQQIETLCNIVYCCSTEDLKELFDSIYDNWIKSQGTKEFHAGEKFMFKIFCIKIFGSKLDKECISVCGHTLNKNCPNSCATKEETAKEIREIIRDNFKYWVVEKYRILKEKEMNKK